jgi:hypothetical protein
VLASYFEYRIRCDTEDGRGPWKGRINPASAFDNAGRFEVSA